MTETLRPKPTPLFNDPHTGLLLTTTAAQTAALAALDSVYVTLPAASYHRRLALNQVRDALERAFTVWRP